MNTYRIDSSFVIKVADFGLSEDIYARNYFRQQEMSKDDSGEKSGVVKLPIRWMALESLHDGIFSEKTDVVSVGHEVFIDHIDHDLKQFLCDT